MEACHVTSDTDKVKQDTLVIALEDDCSECIGSIFKRL